jgi:hypothetical protein
MPRAETMFEHHQEPLLPRALFILRLARGFVAGLAVFGVSLGIGMLGYHHFEHMPWLDAFANSSMILSGMGPLMALETPAGKLFAGVYALFSGLAFAAILGLVFAPVAHRVLHSLHTSHRNKEQSHE